MNAPVWVLDTNVVVSGLLSTHGPPARLLDAVLAARLRLAFDDRIEAEYREVLARPRLMISPARREAFLAVLTLHETVAQRPWAGPSPPDPDDLPFLEVASASSHHTLVTGNLRHYPMKMIRHEDGGVNLPGAFRASLGQRLREAPPILVVMEDRLTPVPPVHHVIDRASVLISQLARHTAGNLAPRPNKSIRD